MLAINVTLAMLRLLVGEMKLDLSALFYGANKLTKLELETLSESKQAGQDAMLEI